MCEHEYEYLESRGGQDIYQCVLCEKLKYEALDCTGG